MILFSIQPQFLRKQNQSYHLQKNASQTVNSEVTKYGLEAVTTATVVFQTVQH